MRNAIRCAALSPTHEVLGQDEEKGTEKLERASAGACRCQTFAGKYFECVMRPLPYLLYRGFCQQGAVLQRGRSVPGLCRENPSRHTELCPRSLIDVPTGNGLQCKSLRREDGAYLQEVAV